MIPYFNVLIVILILIVKNVSADNSSTSEQQTDPIVDNNIVVLHLDDNMNRILFNLFVEVFGNNQNNTEIEVPVSIVAEIYRNYTQEELDSLRIELKKLDHRFDIVRKRVDGLQEKFLISNIEYSLSKNLSKYEKNFIQIGEQLITLQKLVLKFTNADKPIDENSIQSVRSGRKSMVTTLFDRLARLLLGLSTDQTNNQQNSEPLNPNQLNKIMSLMKTLQSVKNVSTNQMSGKMQTDLIKLQTMLYRLQQIQLLNRLADERVFHSSSNMNPYRYEAILNLVKLVGTASGQNQLRAIMRLFTAPQTVNRVRNTNVSQEKLKLLMKVVEEQEKQRRQQLENQRQKDILNELLKNQKRQQQQIDSLIKLIETQNRNNNNNNINDNFNKNINNNNLFNVITTTTESSSTSNQNEILSKLREQRRQLNNLLKTLGTDFNTNNNNMPTNSPVIGGQTNNLGKTHENFNNLLQTIGPMIGALAQTGLISPNQNQLTQNSLSELLNSNNFNNRIQYDSYKSKASKFIDLLGSILNL